MERIWHYLDNSFLVVGERSYKRALIISNYHEAALVAAILNDPDLEPLGLRYTPLHNNLVKEYNTWKNAGGQQSGSTLNLDQLMALVYGKLDNWEPRIQVVHPKSTPRYKEIFPNGRKPFTKGKIDERIEAVNTLQTNIGTDAALVAVHTEVATYYTDLDTARDQQSGKKGGKKTGSLVLSTAIEAAMVMQYRNLGALIDKFGETPELVAPFFDVQTIRERDQRVFTGTLDPSENEAVLKHTFLADDELRLKIEGNGNARFYLGSTDNATNSNYIEIIGNHEQTITLSQFGVTDYHAHRFLTVVNQSITEKLKYLVEVY